MKKIIFSTHALLRMAEWGIMEREIISAIASPDKVEQSITNSNRFLIKKLYFNERFQKEHLLIIVTESNRIAIKVITVIDTSKISRHF